MSAIVVVDHLLRNLVMRSFLSLSVASLFLLVLACSAGAGGGIETLGRLLNE